MKILFVCTGNTCRSFMAEVLAREIIKSCDWENKFKVASAGLAAFPGDPASKHALDVLRDEGITPPEHKAVRLTGEFLEEADLVLTMTHGQKNYLLSLFPEAGERVHILKEFCDQRVLGSLQNKQSYDIADPFGQSRHTYQACVRELRQIVDKLFRKMAEEDFQL